MKNDKKKGFTLVELIAVIAILSILLMLALPQVLEMFRETRESAFLTQVQYIYRAAEEQYVSDQLAPESGTTNITYCKDEANTKTDDDLNLSNDDVQYKIVFTDGKITTFIVSDGNESLTVNAEEGQTVKIGNLTTPDTDLATITCE